MSDNFSEFSNSFSPKEFSSAFAHYKSPDMVEAAKTILLERHDSDSAYLGALTVLMINGMM